MSRIHSRTKEPAYSKPRSRHSSGSDSEFKVECKAAFLSIYDDIKDEISSEKELSAVLQQAGRNPSKKTLAKYWDYDTRSLGFDDFVNICRREPVTTTDDLMKAFHKIDTNGDGYISLDELFRMLTTRGDKMTREEVRDMIDEVDKNKDGRLDYEEFCNMIVSTAEDCKKMSMKLMEKKDRKKRLLGKPDGSNTPRRGSKLSRKSSVSSLVSREIPLPDERKQDLDKEIEEDISPRDENVTRRSSINRSPRKLQPQDRRGSQLSFKSHTDGVTEADGRAPSHSSLRSDDMPKASPRAKKDKVRLPVASRNTRAPEPSNLREWAHTSSKGCFFVDSDEGGAIISHQYLLDLPDDTGVFITMQPNKIADAGWTDDGPIDTAVYVLRHGSSSVDRVVTFTDQRDSKGKYHVRCDLPAGKYKLVPFTTGCRLKERSGRDTKEAKLIKKDKDDKVVLSKAFKKALEEIFNMVDLDGNGLLSREEFNWFNNRTSGDDVADDEWDVVENNMNIQLEDGEITKAGFIRLNEMEAEDNDGDEEDLWVTLTSMGYNKSLVLDQVCPFKLDVYTEDCDDAELKVMGLRPMDNAIEDAVSESVIAKGEASRVKGMKDLCVYTYIGDARASIVVENKSHTRVRLELDCSRSKNVVSNLRDLNCRMEVPSNTVAIGHHLIPRDERAEWIVRCQETILK